MNFNLARYDQAWQVCHLRSRADFALDSVEPLPLQVFDCLSSTNASLRSGITQGLKLPAGIIALEQSAGKGQWGNQWSSFPGGLYLSVGLALDLPLTNYPHLVMATAWGIAEVLNCWDIPVKLKWFNDLLLTGRKLGGIKIETRNHQARLTTAVVGIGLNWCNLVPEPGINLADYFQDLENPRLNSLEQLAAIACYGSLMGYQYYLQEGIEQLLTRYLERLANLGQRLELDGASGEVTGVTPEGKLVVTLRSPGATTKVMLAPGQISLGYSS